MIIADWLVIYSLVLMVSRKCELDCHRFLFRWVWDRCNETQTDTQIESCDRFSKKKRRRPDHAAVDCCCRQGAASPSKTSTITVIIYIRSVDRGTRKSNAPELHRHLPANQSFCVGIESAYLPHRSADQINQIQSIGLGQRKGL
jgi:hypothetical protein